MSSGVRSASALATITLSPGSVVCAPAGRGHPHVAHIAMASSDNAGSVPLDFGGWTTRMPRDRGSAEIGVPDRGFEEIAVIGGGGGESVMLGYIARLCARRVPQVNLAAGPAW